LPKLWNLWGWNLAGWNLAGWNLLGLGALALILGGSLMPAALRAQDVTVVINEFLAVNEGCCTDDFDEADDWVEFYNYGEVSVDVGGMYVTDNLDRPTKFQLSSNDPRQTTIAPGSYLVFWFDGQPEQGALHVDFKLKGAGEELGLFAADGVTPIDTLGFDAQRIDVSRGRRPDGGEDWFFLPEPTPGRSNGTAIETGGLLAPVAAPEFSTKGGFIDGPVALTLGGEAADVRIYFTQNGDVPQPLDSLLYGEPIQIDVTRIIRARAYRDGHLPSPIVTHSFILAPLNNPSLPTVSLVTDPANLWDEIEGIYSVGPDVGPDDEWPFFAANFWRVRSKSGHVEYFEVDGDRDFAADVELAISGRRNGRASLKKSFSLDVRGPQGEGEIDYKLFDSVDYEDFSKLTLRAGEDWSQLREGLFNEAQQQMDSEVDMQASRLVVLLLNGQYWGVYQLMERKGGEFYRHRHGVRSVDIMKWDGTLVEGEGAHYESMLSFLNESDISQAEHYAHLQTLMEVDNFIDFCILALYSGRPDNIGNMRYWRPATTAGRWRWQLFDIDLWSSEYHRTLDELLTEKRAVGYQLLGRLVANADFRRRFLNRLADHLNTALAGENVESIVRRQAGALDVAITADLQRWGQWYGKGYWPLNRWYLWYEGEDPGRKFGLADWVEERDRLIGFAHRRPDVIRQHAVEAFDLAGTVAVGVSANSGEGRIRINSLKPDLPWAGTYFSGVALEIEAMPASGYRFAGWSDADLPATARLEVSLTTDYALAARFVPVTPSDLPVWFSEISYNASEGFDSGDWVELFNAGDEPIDLSGWHFRDEGHDFELAEGVVIVAGGFVVLCQDEERMRARFPDGVDCHGNWSFGLSGGGEEIGLYDAAGLEVDRVEYDDEAPWPLAADGGGHTLVVKQGAEIDHAAGENWVASAGNGTPGAKNRFGAVDTAVVEPEEGLPAQMQLSQNYPNPFNSATAVEFVLPAAGNVRLTVYSPAGQAVRRLVDGWMGSGTHLRRWNGLDQRGLPVGTGVYLYRLQTDARELVGKMLLLR
jgi:hypothetical protein